MKQLMLQAIRDELERGFYELQSHYDWALQHPHRDAAMIEVTYRDLRAILEQMSDCFTAVYSEADECFRPGQIDRAYESLCITLNEYDESSTLAKGALTGESHGLFFGRKGASVAYAIRDAAVDLCSFLRKRSKYPTYWGGMRRAEPWFDSANYQQTRADIDIVFPCWQITTDWSGWHPPGEWWKKFPKSASWCRGQMQKWITDGSVERLGSRGDIRFRLSFLKEMEVDPPG